MATGEILAWEEMVGGTKAAPLDTSRTELPKVNRHLWTLVQISAALLDGKSCSTIFLNMEKKFIDEQPAVFISGWSRAVAAYGCIFGAV